MYSILDATKLLEENYHGSYDSEVDFASQLFRFTQYLVQIQM